MDDYKIIVEQEHQTVMAHYEVGAKPDGGYKKVGSLSDPAVFPIYHFRKRPNIPTMDLLKPV